MAENKEKKRQWVYLSSDLHGDSTLRASAMMMPLTLCAILLWLPSSHASDNWEIEGSHGTLQVQGNLTESACRLDMSSARQDVWMKDTGTARLAVPGDRAAPVAFEMRLTDCLRTQAGQRDGRTGALSWSSVQPTVSVSFHAPADMDNPQLVKAQGVSGLGLRLLDSRGEDVRLGSRGKPLFLTPGHSSLYYTVIPERTSAPLLAGAYRAAVDFQLSYD